jgi:ubiquinone/menaquinone biosynthesis C-methylase UbiE
MPASNKNNLLNVDLLIDKIVISNNDKIADLGCGSFGYFVFPLAKKIGKHGKVYAVDIIKNNLESIKNMARTDNLTQIETIWSNLEVYNGTKIPSESLDAVLLVGLLHQSDKHLDILKESVRMLKTGGRLLIVEWNEDDFVFGNRDVKRISQNKIKEDLAQFSLTMQEEFVAGEYHYGLLLIKN